MITHVLGATSCVASNRQTEQIIKLKLKKTQNKDVGCHCNKDALHLFRQLLLIYIVYMLFTYRQLPVHGTPAGSLARRRGPHGAVKQYSLVLEQTVKWAGCIIRFLLQLSKIKALDCVEGNEQEEASKSARFTGRN